MYTHTHTHSLTPVFCVAGVAGAAGRVVPYIDKVKIVFSFFLPVCCFAGAAGRVVPYIEKVFFSFSFPVCYVAGAAGRVVPYIADNGRFEF
jgi:hypothetical protein